MFMEWIQKSGEAQAAFAKNFGDMIVSQQKEFDPLSTLSDLSSRATSVQKNMMESLGNIQAAGLGRFFNSGFGMPNLLEWGAYKTSVGNNGRISIPEAEREALRISEGDLVQVIIMPIARKEKEVRE